MTIKITVTRNDGKPGTYTVHGAGSIVTCDECGARFGLTEGNCDLMHGCPNDPDECVSEH